MTPTLEQIKTDESVWPEGAEYYTEGTKESFPMFYKFLDGDLYWIIANRVDKWGECRYKEIPDSAIPRPAKSEWVPEVGVECEFKHPSLGHQIWVGCTPIGMFLGKMVCAPDGGGFFQGGLKSYRQIKSERQKFIDIVGSKQLLTEMSVNDLAGVLYDAGCRFMEQPK